MIPSNGVSIFELYPEISPNVNELFWAPATGIRPLSGSHTKVCGCLRTKSSKQVVSPAVFTLAKQVIELHADLRLMKN
jgi:hypothetical protein